MLHTIPLEITLQHFQIWSVYRFHRVLFIPHYKPTRILPHRLQHYGHFFLAMPNKLIKNIFFLEMGIKVDFWYGIASWPADARKKSSEIWKLLKMAKKGLKTNYSWISPNIQIYSEIYAGFERTKKFPFIGVWVWGSAGGGRRSIKLNPLSSIKVNRIRSNSIDGFD
jgi:hypothetical protein